MVLLSLIALLLVGASAALVIRAVALPRMKAADRVRDINAYGFNAHPAIVLEDGRQAPTFAELAGSLGTLLMGRFTRLRPEEMRRELLAAGLYQLTPVALLGYRVVACLIMGVVGLYWSTRAPGWAALPITGGLASLGWILPVVLVRRRARQRMGDIERELPELIDLLVVTVEAGLGLGASLQLASGKIRGPLADEVRLTLREQQMGRPLTEALLRMVERADTVGMRSFVRSISQGETRGVSIGKIMRDLAADSRKRRRYAAEEQARKAPTKMLFPLVFLILPAFGLIVLGPAVFSMIDTLGGT